MPIFTTLVDDTFPQADGPLELVNWTVSALGGAVNGQVASHRLEPSSTQFVSTALYTGAVGWIVGGQFVEVTIPTFAGEADNFADFFLFANSDLSTGLACNLQPVGGGAQILIQIFDAVGNQIGTDITLTFVPGAKYRLECFNGVITQFYNGVKIATYTGQSQFLTASGVPAFYMVCNDAVTNIQISEFVAGTIAASPSPPGSGSSGFGFDFRFRL